MLDNKIEQLSNNINNIVAAYGQDSYSIIAIEGEKSSQFLQGQITINSANIEELGIKPGLYCDVKGRAEASFQLFRIDTTFYMLLPSDNLAPTMSELKKYAMLSRVNVKVCNNFVPIFLINIDCNKLFNNSPLRGYLSPTDFGYIFSNEMNSYCHLTHADNIDEFKKYLNEEKIEFIDYNLQNTINILNKQPEIFNQSRGIFLPHYINAAEKLVDFNKGCFRGQEVIARMQYKVKSYKYGVYLFKTTEDKPISPGDIVKNEDGINIGNVIIASTKDNIALFMVSNSHIEVSNVAKVDNQQFEIIKEE